MAEPQPPKAQMPGPRSIEEFRYLQQLYQSQYTILTNDINARLEYLRELDGAQTTIEGFPQVREKGSLMPIGAGVYVGAKIEKANNVVVEIGAGYVVEKDIDGAKALLAKRREAQTQIIEKQMKSRKEIEAALIDLSYKVEELSHSH